MLNNRIKFFLMAVLIVGAAFFMSKEKTVRAQTEADGSYMNIRTAVNDSVDDAAIVLKDSSGVKELDDAADKTKTVIKWVVAFIGGLIFLFGLIYALINAAGHNTEQRNMGFIALGVGLLIVFAVPITSWITGW
ncbi:MAG: hypothetical protein IJT37_09530 [Lachnospiraceae bacterium]|nr:hypothetical protein [Lachnospiraceae bacterium]